MLDLEVPLQQDVFIATNTHKPESKFCDEHEKAQKLVTASDKGQNGYWPLNWMGNMELDNIPPPKLDLMILKSYITKCNSWVSSTPASYS